MSTTAHTYPPRPPIPKDILAGSYVLLPSATANQDGATHDATSDSAPPARPGQVDAGGFSTDSPAPGRKTTKCFGFGPDSLCTITPYYTTKPKPKLPKQTRNSEPRTQRTQQQDGATHPKEGCPLNKEELWAKACQRTKGQLGEFESVIQWSMQVYLSDTKDVPPVLQEKSPEAKAQSGVEGDGAEEEDEYVDVAQALEPDEALEPDDCSDASWDDADSMTTQSLHRVLDSRYAVKDKDNFDSASDSVLTAMDQPFKMDSWRLARSRMWRKYSDSSSSENGSSRRLSRSCSRSEES